MIKVKDWVGRLGNNIIELINILHIAIYYNYRIDFPKKGFITPYIDLEYIKKQFQNNILQGILLTDPSNFYYRQKIKNITQEVFNVNHVKVFDIIHKAFIIREESVIDKNDIVLHIRGGDVFNGNPHPGYAQPPLSYYINILDNNNFNKIIIVSEDTKNPVLNELLKKYPNIIYKKQTLEEDIKIIMGTSKIVNSFGSFIPYLLLFSNNIKHLYQTSYQLINIDQRLDIPYEKYNISNFNIHVTDLTDYKLKITPWKNTQNQKDIMLTYITEVG